MSGVDHHIRYLGANVRESLATHYVNRGSEFGYALARRITSEMVAHVREAHGDRVAFEMVSGVGDRLLKDKLFEPMTPLEGREIGAALVIDDDKDGELLPPDGPYPEGTWALQFSPEVANVVCHDAPEPAAQLVKLQPYVRYLEGEVAKVQPRWRRVLRTIRPPAWFCTLVLGFVIGAAR